MCVAVIATHMLNILKEHDCFSRLLQRYRSLMRTFGSCRIPTLIDLPPFKQPWRYTRFLPAPTYADLTLCVCSQTYVVQILADP